MPAERNGIQPTRKSLPEITIIGMFEQEKYHPAHCGSAQVFIGHRGEIFEKILEGWEVGLKGTPQVFIHVYQLAEFYGGRPSILSVVEHQWKDGGEFFCFRILAQMVFPDPAHIDQNAKSHFRVHTALMFKEQIE